MLKKPNLPNGLWLKFKLGVYGAGITQMDKRASDAWESKIGLLFQVNVMLTSDSEFPVVSNWDEFVKEASFFLKSQR